MLYVTAITRKRVAEAEATTIKRRDRVRFFLHCLRSSDVFHSRDSMLLGRRRHVHIEYEGKD